jgi:hypothetical protein
VAQYLSRKIETLSLSTNIKKKEGKKRERKEEGGGEREGGREGGRK